MSLTVSPLFSERKEDEFDVFEALLDTLNKNDERLQEGDVIVISTKYISNSQGRLIDLNNVKTSKEGTEVSKKFQIKAEIAEVILRESDKIFGGISGFVITSADNIMAPNAGIEPVLDMRAEKDLDGNPLKVTFQAVVDNLATIANHKMGEAAESKPFAIIRDSGAKLTDRKISPTEMAISPDQCVYVRGLTNPMNY